MSGLDSPSRFAAAPVSAPADLESLEEIVAGMTVAEIKEAVERGDLEVAEVVAAEQAGKQRVTVLALAEPAPVSESDPAEPTPEA